MVSLVMVRVATLKIISYKLRRKVVDFVDINFKKFRRKIKILITRKGWLDEKLIRIIKPIETCHYKNIQSVSKC